jgi:subtilisin family serine protease
MASRRRSRLLAISLLLFAALPAAAVWPPPRDPSLRWVERPDAAPQPEVRPDALIVKMRQPADATSSQGPLGLLAGQPVLNVAPLFAWPSRQHSQPKAGTRPAGVFRVSFRQPVDVAALSRRLALDARVEYAEPVFRARVAALTNDPYLSTSGAWGQPYQDLWGLHTISAPAAWDQSTGQGVVVAVVDTGSDLAHPDLAGNLWQNPGEVPGNLVDDDGNGFVDDVRGWDFANGDADPFDGHGHGTHVAGTIAAVGNNGTGVVGVAWGAKVMTVKGLDDFGSGFTDQLAEGIAYAAENGARVINMSWGLFGYSQVLEDALAAAYAQGVVLVAAAGNSNLEAWQFHPASSRFVLCIGASTPADLRAWFSNFGGSLDVLAPGGADSFGSSNILSLRSSVLDAFIPPELLVGDRYLRFQGTSMAAPHAAGLAALVLEDQPGLTPEEVRQVIRRSAADVYAAGWDVDSAYGRIAAAAAVSGPVVRGSARLLSPRAREVLSGLSQVVTGTATSPAFASWTLERGTGLSPSTWAFVTSSPTPVVSGQLTAWDIG